MSRDSRWSYRSANRFRRLQLEEFETRILLASVPVASSDTFDGVQNRVLNVAAPGLLENDQDADQDPLTAEIVTDATRGSVSVNPDGSFQYTPDLGYVGPDSFTYRAVTLNPSTVFTIDQSRSSIHLDATLGTSFGSDSDDDSSSLTGTITKRLTPNESPFNEIHITDFDMVVADGLSLNFRFAFGLAGLDIDLPADPSPNPQLQPFRLTMVNPGEAAPVVNGDFNQANNQLMLAGIIDLDATGLADGQIPEGPTPFNIDNAVTDLMGSAVQNGATITITSPLAFSGTFEASGNTIDVVVTGNLVATGNVVTEPEYSAPTTVSIDVIDTTPPTVIDVTLNAIHSDPANLPKGAQPTSWDEQRSDINSITIKFSEPIQAAFFTDIELKNLGIDAPNDPDAIITFDPFDVAHNRDMITIRFPTTPLPEGVYQLQVFSTIRDFVNLNLDGNGDGVGDDTFIYTGNATNSFHRIIADWNGDGGASVFDFSTFAYWFGVAIPDAPSYVDLNDDDGVSVFDFTGFADNFGLGVVYPVAFSNEQVGSNGHASAEAAVAAPDQIEGHQFADDQIANPIVDWRTMPKAARLQPEIGDTKVDESVLENLLLDEALFEEIAGVWNR
ncbi:MAG: hypothetical protein ACI9HK_001702 [Pirellulaceae bacterium]|jgi:hypothetical protein